MRWVVLQVAIKAIALHANIDHAAKTLAKLAGVGAGVVIQIYLDTLVFMRCFDQCFTGVGAIIAALESEDFAPWYGGGWGIFPMCHDGNRLHLRQAFDYVFTDG